MKFRWLGVLSVIGSLLVLNGCATSGGDKQVDDESPGAVALSFAGLDVQLWVDMLELIEPQIEAEGYEFLSDDPQWNIQNQVSNWQSWIIRGDLKALMGAPVQTDAMYAVTQEAQAAGVPVLGYSTEWEGVEGALLIDNYEDGFNLGKLAGEWVVAEYGDIEVPVFLYSNYDTDLGIDRSEGVKAGLAEAGANAIYSESAALSVSDSYEAAVSQLSANPDTKVWLGIGSDQIVGASRALSDHGVSMTDESYLLGALDATNEALDVIEREGSIWRFAFILPAAELADGIVEMLLTAAQGVPVENMHVSSTRVTPGNANEFRLSQ